MRKNEPAGSQPAGVRIVPPAAEIAGAARQKRVVGPIVLRPRRRRARLVADLGLALLPVLAIEILTGLVLFLFAHGLVPRGEGWAQAIFDGLAAANLLVLQDVPFQTDVHVWVGYLTCWLVALKIWASWPTLVGWWPRRFSLPRLAGEKLAAGSLLVLASAAYLTGVALTLRPVPFPRGALRDVHLVVSALLLVPLAWHLARFLSLSQRIAAVQLARLRARRRPARREYL